MSETLDPRDWEAFRALAHRALDETLDGIRDIGERPPWRAIPGDVRMSITFDPLPQTPSAVEGVYEQFRAWIAPYAVDNRHPRFFGWVHGAGTPAGVLAEMLAAGMNANLGGRDHAAVEVERRVVRWWNDIFGFPATASGLLTSGTSMASLIGLLVARRRALGADVRANGVGSVRLTAYASSEAHGSVARAFDTMGLGRDALRTVTVDETLGIDVEALRNAVYADTATGAKPFAVIATAGSAGTGAFDNLHALADLCADEGLWLHVDGAFGALTKLSPTDRHAVSGIERADSIAFDLHKWLHVPYDVGAVLVRDGELHAATFADHAPYLARTTRGTAAGEPWFTDFGPELSRGFRALKVWFTMKTLGLDAIGASIASRCALARDAGAYIATRPELELLAPVTLNVVCFRHVPPGVPEAELDRHNERIVVALQEDGTAVPSTTRVNGKLAIRLNIMNHRTTGADVRRAIDAAIAAGERPTR